MSKTALVLIHSSIMLLCTSGGLNSDMLPLWCIYPIQYNHWDCEYEDFIPITELCYIAQWTLIKEDYSGGPKPIT